MVVDRPEEWVIGSLLLDPGRFSAIREILEPDDFENPELGEIYSGMDLSIRECGTFDIGTVLAGMKKNSGEKKNLALSIAKIINSVPHPLHVHHYAKIVLEKSATRLTKIIGESMAMIDEFENPGEISLSYQRKLSEVAKKLDRIKKKNRIVTEGSIRESIYSFLDSREQEENQGGRIPTAMEELDEFVGGKLPKGSFIVVGARPGNGKTMFLLESLRRAAKAGNICVFYSQEMSYDAIGERLLSVAVGDRAGEMSREEIRSVVQEFFKGVAIVFRQVPGDVSAITSDMRRCADEYGATVCGIDYLGLIRGEGRTSYERVTTVVRELKQVSVELDMTTFLACQLNRMDRNQSGRFNDAAPKESHLRDSGEIEAVSDATFLLRYPWKDSTQKKIIEWLEKNSISNVTAKEYFEIRVPKLKNRSIPGGIFPCKFQQSPTLGFVSAVDSSDPDYGEF